MLTNAKRIKADTDSSWNWKGNHGNMKKNEKKQFPVAKFLQNNQKKAEEAILGPGGGAGIGCGAGIGFGLVGGVGYGGWPWNHLQLAFGIGVGCGVGVGVGFGYGLGIGYGLSWDSLRSYVSKESSSDSRKRILIDI